MPQAVDHVAVALEQLSEQVRNLERRVAALESNPETPTSNESTQPASLATEHPGPPATWREFLPFETPSGVVTIVGKAVLGIAGAYLLRALAESPSIPKWPIVLVAIAYACGWMLWAVRVHSISHVASGVYAVTSALILAPMLWESTVRFQVLSPAFSAAVTVAFVALAIVMAWREDLQLIPWMATLASVITVLALIIETHDLVPLTAALLVVALFTEVAACLGHRLTLRAFPALAADFAVWLLVFVLASETIAEGYHATSSNTLAILSLLLLAVYGASIGVRSFILRQPITVFEIGQVLFAFVLASYGALRATHDLIARPLGAAFLALGAVCYWGSLLWFRDDSQPRNRRVSAAWAAALSVAGIFLLCRPNAQIAFLSLAAVAAAFVYRLTQKLSLGIHATFYLAAAAAVSTLPTYGARALAQDVPAAPDWSAWVVAIAATASYLLGSHAKEGQFNKRWLWIIPAALVSFAVAAFAVAALVALVFRHDNVAASSLSVIRTVVICGVALILAILSSRLQRAELGWLAYTAVALGTLKLLVEDLRFGNAASLVVSLLFYGIILITLPRLTRKREIHA